MIGLSSKLSFDEKGLRVFGLDIFSEECTFRELTRMA